MDKEIAQTLEDIRQLLIKHTQILNTVLFMLLDDGDDGVEEPTTRKIFTENQEKFLIDLERGLN